MANVHTMSVDFLRILAYMGVEARIIQYKWKFALFACMGKYLLTKNQIIMKKIITALMLCFVSIISFSQIQVQKGPETREVIRVMGMNSSVTIVEVKDDDHTSYYIRSITTNRYDETFLLPIGHSEEEVIVSLEALNQMASAKKGETFAINDNFRATVVAKNTLYLGGKGYAGNAEITKKQIEKLLKYYADGGH